MKKMVLDLFLVYGMGGGGNRQGFVSKIISYIHKKRK